MAKIEKSDFQIFWLVKFCEATKNALMWGITCDIWDYETLLNIYWEE